MEGVGDDVLVQAVGELGCGRRLRSIGVAEAEDGHEGECSAPAVGAAFDLEEELTSSSTWPTTSSGAAFTSSSALPRFAITWKSGSAFRRAHSNSARRSSSAAGRAGRSGRPAARDSAKRSSASSPASPGARSRSSPQVHSRRVPARVRHRAGRAHVARRRGAVGWEGGVKIDAGRRPRRPRGCQAPPAASTRCVAGDM